MSCIKTGAVVYFEEYGFLVPADIYEVSDCRIIRWNNLGPQYMMEPSHTHWLVWIGSDGFHREDLGITIVPRGNCVEVPAIPTAA